MLSRVPFLIQKARITTYFSGSHRLLQYYSVTCFQKRNFVHFPYAHHGYLARMGDTGWLFQYGAKIVFPKKQDEDSYFKTFWRNVPKVSNFRWWAVEKKKFCIASAWAWQWLWMGSRGSGGAMITVTPPPLALLHQVKNKNNMNMCFRFYGKIRF